MNGRLKLQQLIPITELFSASNNKTLIKTTIQI